jgi:hypothetical protein
MVFGCDELRLRYIWDWDQNRDRTGSKTGTKKILTGPCLKIQICQGRGGFFSGG